MRRTVHPLLTAIALLTPPAIAQDITSPVEPEASLALIETADDLHVTLAAAEPLVSDPVAIAFDDAGRMWVVEMGDYPEPIDAQKPQGRVKILTDQDHDGRYDEATVFADGLLFATGVQPWKNGAFVTAGDQLLYLIDDDGDGRSDRQESWLNQLATENPQLRANDPHFGPDLRLYVANGLRTRSITSPEVPQGLDVRGRDIAIDLKTGAIEAITGPSQFGMAWDAYGRRYICSNRNPCDAIRIEAADAALSPLAGVVPAVESVIPAGEDSRVHPLTDAFTTSVLHSGQFSAACGLLVTQTWKLHGRGKLQALVCEPTGSLVHRRVLSAKEGLVQTADAPPEKEFLASRDPWFRPVFLAEGPDGAIYVVDMYRAVIEHPEWAPDELKNRPDARHGEGRGRIYRVANEPVPKKYWADLAERPLGSRTTEELLAILALHGDWRQQQAAILLMDRELNANHVQLLLIRTFDSRSALLAHALFKRHNYQPNVFQQNSFILFMDPPSQASNVEMTAWWRQMRRLDFVKYPVSHAIERQWLNEAWTGATSDVLELRIEALYVLAQLGVEEWERPSNPSRPKGLSRRDEDRVDVRLLNRSVESLALLYADDLEQPYLLAALAAAAKGKLGTVVETWIDHEQLMASQLKVDAVAMKRLIDAAMEEDATQPSSLLVAALRPGRTEDPTPIQLLVLSALIANRIDLTEHRPAIERLAVELVAGEKRDQAGIALGILGRLASPDSIAAIRNALGKPDLFPAAMTAWVDSGDAAFTPWAIERFSGGTPRERETIFAAMWKNPATRKALLAAITTEEISIKNLSAGQVAQLRQLRDEQWAGRIEALLANSVDPNRQHLIERYAASLDAAGDKAAGQAIFATQCASCHRLGDVGQAVGPDISDMRTQTPTAILTSILDPNRAVDNNYFRVSVLTVDDEIIDGVVAEEAGGTITLKTASNQLITLQREEIAELKVTGKSLMPEGLENQISPDQMRDLIFYLKNWRY